MTFEHCWRIHLLCSKEHPTLLGLGGDFVGVNSVADCCSQPSWRDTKTAAASAVAISQEEPRQEEEEKAKTSNAARRPAANKKNSN